MKPIQVGLLMIAAAVGGGLLMTWRNHATRPAAGPAEVADTVPTTISTVPSEPEPSAASRRPLPPANHKNSSAPAPGHEQIASAQRTGQATGQPTAQSPAQPVVAPAPSAPAPVSEPPVRNEPAPPPPPPPPVRVTLGSGTTIAVRTIETLASDRNSPGDSFSATLSQPLVVDGYVIAERGARAEGRVVQSKRAGRVKGAADLAVQLTRLTTADGQNIPIETESFERQGITRTKEEAAKVGGGAALGAIIGAIAGGGKGAGIGAGVGGAAGAGDVLLTHGKPAVLPSETPISFRLRAPVTITEKR
ncbi:MAG: hypothetical protein M3Z85_09735 [Acidobacteriota bacterium]|nr:hypothetical protein [Acidobacteriota bacterium]